MKKEKWERWKGRVSGEFEWTIQGASKEGRRGRAKGGIWMGIRRGLEGRKGESGGGRVNDKRDKMGREKVEGGDGIYKKEIEEVKRENRGKKKRKRVDGRGDFNARTGGGALEDGEEGKRRVSKDKEVNGQEAELMK